MRLVASATPKAEGDADVRMQAMAALRMRDEELLKACRVERMRGSGPGGQHRNKTESYVRLTHMATGATAAAGEERSQALNKARALRRLRTNIALLAPEEDGVVAGGDEEAWAPPAELARWLRLKGAPKGNAIGRKSAEYPLAVAQLMEVLTSHEFAVADAATALGLSTGALSKAVCGDNDLRAAVNRERQRRDMRPLK